MHDSGHLPADWKEANVAAIYKKGPKSDPKNIITDQFL